MERKQQSCYMLINGQNGFTACVHFVPRAFAEEDSVDGQLDHHIAN